MYSTEDFEVFEQRGEALAGAKGVEVHEREPFDGALPDSVKALLQTQCDELQKLRKRWQGDTAGLGDESQSGIDQSIANILAREGIDHTEIIHALRYRRTEAGATEKHDGYYALTVGNAKASADAQRSAGPAQKSNGAANPAIVLSPPQDPGDDLSAKFEALGKLSPVEYDRHRKEEAEDLGIRASTLDEEVAKRRPQNRDSATNQGTAVDFPELEPWPEPVDAGNWLNCVCTELRRYIALPKHADTAIALFSLHTHALEAFTVSPRLALTSPEKRCAKTLTIDVVAHLVPRPLPAANITSAALFRSIEKWGPTLLIDEADTFLRDSDELRGVLNSGHYRATAYVIRTTGEDHEPRRFHTWGAVAIALIGSLPGTLEDRAIVIPMRRRLPAEKVKRFRLDDGAGLSDFPRSAARWAADHLDELRAADPDLPDGLHDRARDNWRPLIAIADLAGGDWPKLARDAAKALTPAEDESSIGVLLLADIRGIFDGRGNPEVMPSHDLCEGLVDLQDRPWSEIRRGGKPLTTNALARRLKPFMVSPDQHKVKNENIRGYAFADFSEAFKRYLPPNAQASTEPTATPLPSNENRHLAVSQPLPAVGAGSGWDRANCLETLTGSGVAVEKPEASREDPEEVPF
ncbi:MAG: DUF3631 domain-containing protein [Myxococcales bacterium]|nr:DUF3631 domain-containing protein [Myxococcales bacterium]